MVDKMGGNPDGNIISALGQYNGWMPGMVRLRSGVRLVTSPMLTRIIFSLPQFAAQGAEYGPQGQKVSYLDE